jgi:hypothetical protein
VAHEEAFCSPSSKTAASSPTRAFCSAGACGPVSASARMRRLRREGCVTPLGSSRPTRAPCPTPTRHRSPATRALLGSVGARLGREIICMSRGMCIRRGAGPSHPSCATSLVCCQPAVPLGKLTAQKSSKRWRSVKVAKAVGQLPAGGKLQVPSAPTCSEGNSHRAPDGKPALQALHRNKEITWRRPKRNDRTKKNKEQAAIKRHGQSLGGGGARGRAPAARKLPECSAGVLRYSAATGVSSGLRAACGDRGPAASRCRERAHLRGPQVRATQAAGAAAGRDWRPLVRLHSTAPRRWQSRRCARPPGSTRGQLAAAARGGGAAAAGSVCGGRIAHLAHRALAAGQQKDGGV